MHKEPSPQSEKKREECNEKPCYFTKKEKLLSELITVRVSLTTGRKTGQAIPLLHALWP